MKKVINVVGGILVFGGLLAIMGSANDCDGKCMELANDIPTMLTVIAGGLASMGIGAAIIFKNS